MTYQLQLCVHMLHDQLNRHLILAATRHNNIRMGHRRCNVITVRRFYHGRVLLQHTLDVSTALCNITNRTHQ